MRLRRGLAERMIESLRGPVEETALLEELIPDARPSPAPPKPETISPPPVRGAKSIIRSPRSPADSQTRRSKAPLWIALGGAVGLLASIVGAIVWVAGNTGSGDSQKGLVLARGSGVSTPGRADVSTPRRADVKTGDVIPREDTAATPKKPEPLPKQPDPLPPTWKSLANGFAPKPLIRKDFRFRGRPFVSSPRQG